MPLLDTISSLRNWLPNFRTGRMPSGTGLGAVEVPSRFVDSDRQNKQDGTAPSVTGPQIFVAPGLSYLSSPQLPDRNHQNYGKFRRIRLDPTVALVRDIVVSSIVEAGWSYESDEDAPDGAEDLVKSVMEPLRRKFVKQAMEGFIDYGWQTWEIVTAVDDDENDTIVELKPLLQELTILLVDRRTGHLIGLLQRQLNAAMSEIPVEMVDGVLTAGIVLFRDELVHFSPDTEGTYWYGRPLLERLLETDASYSTVEAAAHRYDAKIAGAHWVVHYPIGTSDFNGQKDVDNAVIAQAILKSLQSSGTVSVPRKLVPYSDALSVQAEDAWRIELISAQASAAAQFVDREKYLDTLKVRAFGSPERAMLEGQHGTMAEAGAHQDLGTIVFEARHGSICETANRGPVDLVLESNYGPKHRGSVRVKPIPISDSTVAFLQKVYTTIMQGPAATAELKCLDMSNVRERLGVPFDKAEADAAHADFVALQSEQQKANVVTAKMGQISGPANPNHPAFGDNADSSKSD